MQSRYLVLLMILAAAHVQAQFSLPNNYELVWADEFDTDSLNEDNWSHRGLNQQRRMAFNSDKTVSVTDGNLHLTTTLDSGVYKTSMISTHGKYEPTFGYYETKVKLQREVGHWSAFWLQSPNVSKEVRDTTRKEIDIFEYLPNKKNRIQHALHRGRAYAMESKSRAFRNKKLKKGWHVFGLMWTENEYVFYIDGKETWRTSNPKVSKNRKYIILSLEVGDWAGNIQKADLPDEFLVDYVRVYQAKE